MTNGNMSIWADIHRRSNGKQERKEDFSTLEMCLDVKERGTLFPAKFQVPDDVRMIKIYYRLCPKDEKDTCLRAEYLVWAYKLRKKDISEFLQILLDVFEEFGEWTYYRYKGTMNEKLSDTSKRMIKVIRDRVSQHNEVVCGIPLWTDNSVPTIIDEGI